jgi:hypothetical protein
MPQVALFVLYAPLLRACDGPLSAWCLSDVQWPDHQRHRRLSATPRQSLRRPPGWNFVLASSANPKAWGNRSMRSCSAGVGGSPALAIALTPCSTAPLVGLRHQRRQHLDGPLASRQQNEELVADQGLELLEGQVRRLADCRAQREGSIVKILISYSEPVSSGIDHCYPSRLSIGNRSDRAVDNL